MRRGGFNVYQAEDLIFCNDNRRSRNGKKNCHCGNNSGGHSCGHKNDEDVDDIRDTLEELRDLIEDLTDEVREKDKRIRRLAKRVEKLEKNSLTPP